MSELRNHKVAIVGVGSVGTAIAYACLIRGSAGAVARYDTYAAAQTADAPAGHLFGSGIVLDSSRFRLLIAQRADRCRPAATLRTAQETLGL